MLLSKIQYWNFCDNCVAFDYVDRIFLSTFLLLLCIAVHASKQEIDAEVCYEYCEECQYAVCVEYYGVAHGFY